MQLRFYSLFAALGIFGSLAAQNVTSTYLANPGFEADADKCTDNVKVTNGTELRGWKVLPTGWTVTETGTDLHITKDCATDNNFGATPIAEGAYAFYQRVGWTDINSSIEQTSLTEIPVGTYQLSLKAKAFAANGAASASTVGIKTAAGKSLANSSISFDAGSTGCMGSTPWKDVTLRFSVEEPTKVTFSVATSWKSGGSQLALDDFTITKLSDVPDDPNAPIEEGETEDKVDSPTEGKLSSAFVAEDQMMADLLQMLTDFTPYAKGIYTSAGSNGYFKGNSAGQNNEDGVRSNADLAMVCAFVSKYAPGKATFPNGITAESLRDMALKALRYGYSTHKANKLQKTTNNAYWGSTSTSDNQWESSLWTMSLAYAAHFLADNLNDTDKDAIYKMIKAECNYELNRSIPTGYNGDTKAEENGWETNILACALGMYPNDELATKWFDRLREFAINCYSQSGDANDKTVVDPDYDNKTVADLFKGACLYDDYTLQNHNYFHTSYQNVVMQELGESHLALALFQGKDAKWKTNALMHNNQKVMDEVLCLLALADGELAMPNGNDWSMFLFDQITSYTTAACFLNDANALLLENLAYKNIKARQTTTTDGSWLLNSDIGPRRMGVEAHRVMMTYLMHEMASTASLAPTSWADFSKAVEPAHLFRSQNIVRANTPARYTIFSWSSGLKNYTGYFVPNNPDIAKIVVPYKANGTGNILGWYEVSGKSTDVNPQVSGIYQLKGNSYAMNGKLATNGSSLNNSFAIYSTPGNALIYVDYVTAAAAGTISKEKGGLLAISVDPFTKPMRTLYHAKGRFQGDGSQLREFESQWVNVDNAIGVAVAGAGNKMAFGDKGNNNSISTAKLYTSYGADSRSFKSGDVVDNRAIVYYSGVSADDTKALSEALVSLAAKCEKGWNGVIATDPDDVCYLLIANFMGNPTCTIDSITTAHGAPVFSVPTTVTAAGAEAIFTCEINNSVADALRVYLTAADKAAVKAWQVPGDSCAVIATSANGEAATIAATILYDGKKLQKADVAIPAEGAVKIYVENGQIVVSPTEIETPDQETYFDITERYLKNPGFEADKSWDKVGSCVLGGVTYDPCYLNELAAANSKFPQVLPVEGWAPQTSLDGSSNYCIMYSMPYSPSMYCVSPSELGNSASIMSKPALFPEAGDRCLSVMNSWTFGTNAVKQTVKLPAGKYKLKFLAQYVCANESGRPAIDHIKASDNDNYSLCGVKYAGTTSNAYPAEANKWEQIVLPFELAEEGDVEISMGLRTTKSVGAANITRLYLDNVSLFSEEDILTGIAPLQAANANVNVYNLQGVLLRSSVSPATATDGLPAGIYIVGSKKVAITR